MIRPKFLKASIAIIGVVAVVASNFAPSVSALSPKGLAKAAFSSLEPSGDTFYRNPQLSIYNDIRLMYRSGQYPDVKTNLADLYKTPIATWLGEWVSEDSLDQATAYVSDVAGKAAARQEIPLFVAYNIPDRDLGQYSSGGRIDRNDYLAWIKAIAMGIGDRKAVVILEPDALAGLAEMSSQGQTARIDMLGEALDILQQNKSTYVYLDAGHDEWLTPEDAAKLLQKVDDGKKRVQGISLNVSSFGATTNVAAYSAKVAELFGNKNLRVLVDVSRNGAGRKLEDGWCNPASARIGKAANNTFDPSLRIETAFIKAPGESDGECNDPDIEKGNPAKMGISAGQFDRDLLHNLLKH